MIGKTAGAVHTLRKFFLIAFTTCLFTCLISQFYVVFRYFSIKRETKTEKIKCLRSQQYQGFTGILYMARPEGFEPPAFGIGTKRYLWQENGCGDFYLSNCLHTYACSMRFWASAEPKKASSFARSALRVRLSRWV